MVQLTVQQRFEIALNFLRNDINYTLGGADHASLRIERHNVWSILVDTDAWWLEFELLSPRRFIVRAVFRSVHSGERAFRDNASEAAMAADLRASLVVLNERMRAVPAQRV